MELMCLVSFVFTWHLCMLALNFFWMQISPDMPSTSTTPNLGKSPEDKRNAKKKKVPPAALKNSKSEKSEKLGALSQLMRLCILKRVDHHKPCL